MEALLEGLQRQLQSNSITVSAACARLSAHLQQATTDDIKALHFCLPSLLSTVLYGGGVNGQQQRQPSWLNKALTGADFDAVASLLGPDGPLFMVLLVHSHKAIYDVSEEQLPVAVQRHLSHGNSTSTAHPLFYVYKDRLVTGVGNSRHQLRLDMAEYFLFYLFHLLFMPKESLSDPNSNTNWVSVLVGDGGNMANNRRVVVNDLLTLRSPGLLQCQFEGEPAAEVYLVLLDRYLKFLLPTQHTQSSAHHLKVQQSSLTRLCEYFITIAVDFLLDNLACEYDVDVITRKPVCRPAVPSVNLDRVLAAQRLVEHLTVSTFTPSLTFAVQGIIETVLPRYRVLLYRYLRLMVSAWPMDMTLSVVMELWMTAVFPWRSIGEQQLLKDVSADLLVRQDFHLIHRLFDDLLSVSTDLFASWTDLPEDRVDGAALAEQAGPVVAALLDCLLNLERLLPQIVNCESEADASFNRSILSRQLHEQLMQREPVEKYHFTPYFHTDSGKQRAAVLAGLVDTCRRRAGVEGEAMAAWANDLERQLRSVFHFDTIITPVLAECRQRRTDDSIASIGRLQVLKRNHLIQRVSIRQKGEIRVLVTLFEWLSTILNTFMHKHLDDKPVIGTFLKHTNVDMRFLAVPGNLILVFVGLWLSLSLLKYLIFGF